MYVFVWGIGVQGLGLLGGSWVLKSRVVSTQSKVASIVTLLNPTHNHP